MRGNVVFLYGRPCSGKTTLAKALIERFPHGKQLDGDILRSGLNKDLGFSPEERHENIRRACEVAKMYSDDGVPVVMSFVAPTPEIRSLISEILTERPVTVVYVATDYLECVARDTKGMYALAKAGKLKNFTGFNGAVFKPTDSDYTIEDKTIEEGIELVLGFVRQDIGKNLII